MVFLETSPALNQSEIEEAERKMSVIFPDEFKKHYLEYNGGYPEKDIYVWSDGGRTTINTFSSIKYDGFQNLENSYRNLTVLEQYLPVGVIPFATDDGGNFFCISAREKDYGNIYYCNNDDYNTEDKEECLTKLGDSFRAFVDGLQSAS